MNRSVRVTVCCCSLRRPLAQQPRPSRRPRDRDVGRRRREAGAGSGLGADRGVESRAHGPREAQKLNTDAMTAVMQKLKGAGLAADAHPDARLRPAAGVRLRERQADAARLRRAQQVQVRVDELPRLGEVIDPAVATGATSVGGVRFDLKDRASRRARGAAPGGRGCASPRRRRRVAAPACAIERVVRIEEQRVSGQPAARCPMMAMRAEDGAGCGGAADRSRARSKCAAR